jgi:hypothetical protein
MENVAGLRRRSPFSIPVARLTQRRKQDYSWTAITSNLILTMAPHCQNTCHRAGEKTSSTEVGGPMAEFSFSKSLLGNKKGALTGSHVAYGLFVLICCWAGAQMLSMLIHAPGYLNA